ncbi:NAD(P)H-dependent oxidoreductase [Glaciecola sp. XM2]|uniref:FMN-dependent NADH-azoreductase n=1 Tax=Glaciecola sp. XM2 TaxID=1914931 RepID=UPI001BDE7C05|nr:NAD(P)H-dependent oxidoreductase [Glaciecola sp. XM2]MBT1449505.1 NAD(P)H-dependent oxidoreductase [Glaciecola sp. XM2]
MKQVLVVNSSLQGKAGNSHKASDAYLAALSNKQEIEVTNIDLNELLLPHLSGAEMAAWGIPSEQRTEEQAQLASWSETFIAQIQRADEIIFAVPMYNFGMPSALKAFFDRVVRAGVTFRYTENGPEGLLKGKQATVIAARGGKYVGTDMDTQTPYIKNLLGFIGLVDAKFFYLEGLAMGEASANEAWKNFEENIVNHLQ